MIEAILKDGTIQRMTVPEAVDAGIDRNAIGRAILADMLA